MKKLLWAMLAVNAWGVCSLAGAQDSYPSRPIKLIVPYPAGGALDSLARPIANSLSQRLGQSVIVENRGGGNLVPASTAVANAAPDGYTLYYTLGQPYSTNQFFFKRLAYDANAYTPIGPVGLYTFTFQVKSNSSFKTLKELVDHAKANPSKLNAATPGATSPGRLALELFSNTTGAKLTQVHYAGGAAQSVAVVGDQVDFMLNDIASSNSFVRSGQVRTLAVNSDKRLPAFPDIPTLAEAGYPGIEIPNAYAVLVGPKGIPEPIVARLSRELAAALETDEVKKILATTAVTPLRGSPADAKRLIDNEASSFGPIIKSLNLTLD